MVIKDGSMGVWIDCSKFLDMVGVKVGAVLFRGGIVLLNHLKVNKSL